MSEYVLNRGKVYDELLSVAAGGDDEEFGKFI